MNINQAEVAIVRATRRLPKSILKTKTTYFEGQESGAKTTSFLDRGSRQQIFLKKEKE
jgi:hypothetical protein